MGLLDDKTAVITGANRGIGRAIAAQLASDGAKVVLCARDADKLAEAVSEIQKAGGQAASVSLDLRQETAPAELVRFALDQFGSVDIVVNNAGATKRGDFLTLSEDDWADGFALKFYSTVRLTRAAWPHLKEASGSVLNIIGVGGRTPGAEFAIGGSVNAALLSLTKALAELGIQDGVQVNAISPGSVRTERFGGRLRAEAESHGGDLESAERSLVKKAQITRIGEPEDIAHLAAFILSPAGRWLQGSLIDMDGGQTKTL